MNWLHPTPQRRNMYRRFREIFALLAFILVAGCATEPELRSERMRPDSEALANFSASIPRQPAAPADIPVQFRFITKKTTLGDVTRKVGQWHRVRGSGVRYYEYDLA